MQTVLCPFSLVLYLCWISYCAVLVQRIKRNCGLRWVCIRLLNGGCPLKEVWVQTVYYPVGIFAFTREPQIQFVWNAILGRHACYFPTELSIWNNAFYNLLSLVLLARKCLFDHIVKKRYVLLINLRSPCQHYHWGEPNSHRGGKQCISAIMPGELALLLESTKKEHFQSMFIYHKNHPDFFYGKSFFKKQIQVNNIFLKKT